MTRSLFAVALLATVTTTVLAAPVPIVAPEALPKGVMARLGSPAFRGPPASGLTYSTDGKRLLALDSKDFGRDDKQSLVVWDADTGKLLLNKMVAPAGLDKFPWVRSVLTGDRIIWLAQVWRPGPLTAEVVATNLEGKVLLRFDVDDQPSFDVEQFRNGFGGSAVSPNGRYLATTVDKGQAVVAYDLTTGARLMFEKLGPKLLPAVGFAQDNTTLFLRQEGKAIRRFELPTGKELPELEGSDHEVWQVAVSPDRKWIVTGKFRTRKVVDGKPRDVDVKELEVRDGRTGKLVGRLEIGGTAQYFAFVATDALLVSTQKVRPPAVPITSFVRWNVATLKREWEVPARDLRFTLSPDGKQFAHGGHIVYLHDTATGKLLAEPTGHTGAVGWIAFSSDGKSLTTAGGEEVITWAVTGERKQRTAVPELCGDRLSNALSTVPGDYFIWMGHTATTPPTAVIYGWDTEKHAIGWRLAVERSWVDPAISPDGKRVVTVRNDRERAGEVVTVFEGATGEKLREWSYPRPKGVTNGTDWPRGIAGGGRFVVLGDSDSVLVLDALTGKEEARVKRDLAKPVPKSDWAPTLAMSENGASLAILERGQLEVYDVKSSKLLARHAFAVGAPRHMKFSADGERLAMWEIAGPKSMRGFLVWDRGDPRQAPRTLGADASLSWIHYVTFSPNNATLAVGYQDGLTLLWDMTAK